MARWNRILAIVLRITGCVQLLAFIFVFLPLDRIKQVNNFLGLCEFPREPIAQYLARAHSAMYGICGVLLLFISSDVIKYARLARFVGYMALLGGVLLVYIDRNIGDNIGGTIINGMPAWWVRLDGPCTAALGVIIVLLESWARAAEEKARKEEEE